MNKIFTSKRDKATTIRTIVYLVIVLAFCIFMISRNNQKDNVDTGLPVLFVAIFITGVIMALRTTYTITADGLLIINTGLRKIRIPVSDIQSAAIQHSYEHFISSPFASSVYQVKIIYKRKSAIVISPVNQAEFIQSLQMHNPAIAAETGAYAV